VAWRLTRILGYVTFRPPAQEALVFATNCWKRWSYCTSAWYISLTSDVFECDLLDRGQVHLQAVCLPRRAMQTLQHTLILIVGACARSSGSENIVRPMRHRQERVLCGWLKVGKPQCQRLYYCFSGRRQEGFEQGRGTSDIGQAFFEALSRARSFTAFSAGASFVIDCCTPLAEARYRL
jgi:hypothetical protein